MIVPTSTTEVTMRRWCTQKPSRTTPVQEVWRVWRVLTTRVPQGRPVEGARKDDPHVTPPYYLENRFFPGRIDDCPVKRVTGLDRKHCLRTSHQVGPTRRPGGPHSHPPRGVPHTTGEIALDGSWVRAQSLRRDRLYVRPGCLGLDTSPVPVVPPELNLFLFRLATSDGAGRCDFVRSISNLSPHLPFHHGV